MRDRVRSFMALLLPAELIEAAAGIQRQAQERFPPGSVKWVEPGNFHLTVRFFGDLDRKGLQKAEGVVAALDAGFAPVAVRVQGVSAFPRPATPQTIWIAVGDEDGRLERLASEIDQRIRGVGFGPPDKPWKSHLTIGRVARDRRLRLDPIWAGGLTWPKEDFTIATVALMESELRPQGPRYTPLRTAAASSRPA